MKKYKQKEILKKYKQKEILKKYKQKEILAARALFVICTRVTTLHSCCMKNAPVFSQSDTRNFFHVYYKCSNRLVITNHARHAHVFVNNFRPTLVNLEISLIIVMYIFI